MGILGKILDPGGIFNKKNRNIGNTLIGMTGIDPLGALGRTITGTKLNAQGLVDPIGAFGSNKIGTPGAVPPGVTNPVLPSQLVRQPTMYPGPPPDAGVLTQLAYRMAGVPPSAPPPAVHPVGPPNMQIPMQPGPGPGIAMQNPLDILRGLRVLRR